MQTAMHSSSMPVGRHRTPFSLPSDEDLLLACRAGDPHAGESIVERYRRLILTVARRAGLNVDQAADFLQNVFTILIEKPDQIQQPDRVGAWSVTTARREAWRVSRHERVTAAAAQPDRLHEDLADDGPLPEEELLRQEAQAQLLTALSVKPG